MTSRLLAGVRVIELTEVWAGPMAASFLGDLGADVIKIESYPRNSMTRPLVANANVGPGEGPPYERSAVHHLSNRNKRNLAVNLRTEQGVEFFRRLLATSDVVMEGYSAGTFERMGFGWETLHALNPTLSLLSLPGWGNEGPYRGYVTLGSGLDASAGHTLLRGDPKRPLEDTVTVYHSDATGAATLVFAVLTALRRRAQTGEGVYIDFSQQEGLNWHLAGQMAEWTFNGRLPQRVGNQEPHVVPHGCYQANGGEGGDDDSWVVLAAEDDAQWAALARAAGHPEWAEDGHSWATVTGRLGDAEAIDAALAEFARSGTAEAIAEAVTAAGAYGAPVMPPWAVLASVQHNARNWFQYRTHAAVGAYVRPGFPWRIAPDDCTWDIECGLLGEHNREVLTELGYSAGEIEALEAAEVFGNRYGPSV
jgi:crotonobetainyl-CoA:carnitine CoA-transferase CaiB-like acyl-CoA transferase